MPGPKTSTDALAWVKEAMSTGLYITHGHFEKRCRQRRCDISDAKQVVKTATKCEAYDAERIFAGGTAWRIVGRDMDGEVTQLGVEAFLDNRGRRVLLVTIMDGGEK